MRRDDDYIRQLLLESESSEDLFIIATQAMGMSAQEKKRYQHAQLLCDAGFFEEGRKGGVYRMTSQGYDYLESIRSNDVWETVKGHLGNIGGGTLIMIRDLALAIAKQRAKEKLGIEL